MVAVGRHICRKSPRHIRWQAPNITTHSAPTAVRNDFEPTRMDIYVIESAPTPVQKGFRSQVTAAARL